MNNVVYSIKLNDETFGSKEGLNVLSISHADPTDIVFTLPDEKGKRFQAIYDSLKGEYKLRTHLRVMSSTSGVFTLDPPQTGEIKEYYLKVSNIDIDTAEGLYVFTCSGKIKR